MEDLFNRLSTVTGITKYSGSEVITPKEIVADMVDLLPAAVFAPDSRFLDPAVKSGRFLAEIYRRLMDSNTMRQALPDEHDRQKHILQNQLYGFATSAFAATVTRKALYNDPTIAGNIAYVDRYLVKMADKTTDFKKLVQGEFGEDMKFDVVIGNPPYQKVDGGGGSSAIAIYHLFFNAAQSLNPRYVCFITPSRWYNGGKGAGLDAFRKFMLQSHRVSTIVDYADCKDCFENVSIAGGVSYWIVDNQLIDGKGKYEKCRVVNINGDETNELTRELDKYKVLIRDNKAIPIINKVMNTTLSVVSSIVKSVDYYGLKGKLDAMVMSSFDDKQYTVYDSKGTVTINREFVSDLDLADSYNVMITHAVGSIVTNGQSGVIPSTLRVLRPKELTSVTYLTIGQFDNEVTAKNLLSYIKTKTFRFLMLQTLGGINISQANFDLIPMQDFSHPWTDQMLYDKYGLTQEEIDYIEATIKPME